MSGAEANRLGQPDAQAEHARLTKIIRVLMDRSERSASSQGSEYSLFQTTIMLEEQVRQRTAELRESLRENERMAQALDERAKAEKKALRDSEQRLRTLLQNSSDMITVVAVDGTVLYQAGAVRSVLGHEPADLEGAKLARWVVDDDLARLRELCQTTDTASAELHLRHRDGRVRTCEVRAASLIGHPAWDGIVLNIRDVTARQQLELELRLAQKLESIGQLAAGIAHEINTPIQFVGDSVVFLESAFRDIDELLGTYGGLRAAAAAGPVSCDLLAAIEEGEDTADLQYLRESIPDAIVRSRAGLARVATIVSAMRNLAHPPTTALEAVDVNETIRTTLVVTANEYKYVSDVTTDLDDQLPPAIANGGDITQVLLNLVVNASHAIADVIGDSGGRGEISIRTRADGEYISVEIADTGGGIPVEIAERVFDPFFTTKDIGRGTGQGLAIARTIVDRHRGQISFRTDPGHGTTFTIRLPTSWANDQADG